MSESTAKLVLQIDTRNAAQGVITLTQNMEGLGKATGEGKDKLTDFQKSLEHASRTFLEVKEAVKTVYEAMNEGVELAKFNAELEHMRESVPVEQLKKMEEGTRATVPQVDLLRFAMKNLNGELRLNADGLGVVSAAAKELAERSGKSTIEVMEQLRMALETGRTRGLREYGIQLQKTGNDQKDLNNLLVKFAQLAAESKPNPDLDRIEHLQKVTADWLAQMRAGIGSVLGEAINLVDKISDKLAGVNTHMTRGEQIAKNANDAGLQAIADRRGISVQQLQNQLDVKYGPSGDYLGLTPEEALLYGETSARNTQYSTSVFRSQGNRESIGKGLLDSYNLLLAGTGGLTEGRPEYGGKGGKGAERYRPFSFGKRGYVGSLEDASKLLFSDYDMALGHVKSPGFGALLTGGYAEAQTSDYAHALNKSDTFANFLKSGLQQVNAPMEQFSTQINDRTTALGAGFGALSDGISSAVEAAITGSDSIGKAFLKASAAALKSIAVESSVRALYNTAMGLGALVLDPPAAAGYFAAAAQFGVAAAAAGAGAALLGEAGGGSSSGGGSSGPRTVPNSSGVVGGTTQQSGPSVINVYVSGAVTAGDYAKLGETIQKSIQLGQQAGRVRADDNLVVTFE